MNMMEHGMSRFSLMCTTLILLVALGASSAQAQNYVVPTHYGYGLVGRPASGWVQPYMVAPYSSAYGTVGAIPYAPYARHPGSYYGPYYGYSGYTGYTPPYGIPAAYGSPAGYYGAGGYMLGQIVTPHLNVRAEPGKGPRGDRDGNVIGSFVEGERVWVLGRSGNWFIVQSADGRPLRGYVHGGYVQAINNSAYSGTTPHYASPYVYSVGMARYGDPRALAPPHAWRW
ncbi:MAG: SH3 domain-containing protein [Candidatus Ozemobacteraceae bacterium]